MLLPFLFRQQYLLLRLPEYLLHQQPVGLMPLLLSLQYVHRILYLLRLPHPHPPFPFSLQVRYLLQPESHEHPLSSRLPYISPDCPLPLLLPLHLLLQEVLRSHLLPDLITSDSHQMAYLSFPLLYESVPLPRKPVLHRHQ